MHERKHLEHLRERQQAVWPEARPWNQYPLWANTSLLSTTDEMKKNELKELI